jgi:RNA polymerase sigma-70 factor (ECF subfamily)
MRPIADANEQDIISRAKGGDMNAFEFLVRKYQRLIYALCHRITGAHQAADDLAQDTFIRAYQALPSFIDGREFYPWVRKIAVNNSLNFIKKRNREAPLADEETLTRPNHLSSHHESPPETAERDELERKFKEALQALPADQKVIFTLRAIENLSYAEIAKALHIPTGTVMSRLSRARKKLRADMAGFLRSAS